MKRIMKKFENKREKEKKVKKYNRTSILLGKIWKEFKQYDEALRLSSSVLPFIAKDYMELLHQQSRDQLLIRSLQAQLQQTEIYDCHDATKPLSTSFIKQSKNGSWKFVEGRQTTEQCYSRCYSRPKTSIASSTSSKDTANWLSIVSIGSLAKDSIVYPRRITISDFAPKHPPMIPEVIVRCVKEVERRGLNKIGLYLYVGGEDEIENLLVELLECNEIDLKDEDIEVVTGVVEVFMRKLVEPLVPWKTLLNAMKPPESLARRRLLLYSLSQHPRPNADLLVFLVTHFKRVIASPRCKMTPRRLFCCFEPKIFGSSSRETSKGKSHDALKILEELLLIPDEDLENFLKRQ